MASGKIRLTSSGKEKMGEAVKAKAGLKLERLWKEEAPVYTGQYRSSITTVVDDNGNVHVGTNLDYAHTLEYGLGMGTWPPVNRLRKWVERVIQPDDLDQATYLIGRKIFQEGVNRNASLRRAIRKFKSQST